MNKIFFRNFDLTKALYRFWPAVIFAVIGSISMVFNIENSAQDAIYAKISITSLLGMLCFINHRILTERFNLSIAFQIGLALIIIAFCSFYFWLLPNKISQINQAVGYRTLGIVLILHLCISFVPYINRGTLSDFWDYNRTVLLLIAESFFNALTLFLGLSIALVALKYLFEVDVDGDTYPEMFVLIIGIFQTSYFLSRYPTQYYDRTINAPSRGQKVFSQYILIPLVSIYLIILYAYGIKILVNQSLPKGWVSNLVLWFTVIGLMAYLLNYFYDQFEKNELAKIFKKWFFYLIPLPLIMLFFAIGRRLSDYGVTENRYVVAILAVWLAGLSIYFIISKKDNIKSIPISLAMVILFAIVSPWNFIHVSEKSQRKQLLSLLEESGLLVDGKLLKPSKEIGNRHSKKIMNKIHYLQRKDQLGFLNKYEVFKSEEYRMLNLEEQENALKRTHNENPKRVAEALNIQYANYNQRVQQDDRFNFYAELGIFDVDGYDRMAEIQIRSTNYPSSETFQCLIDKHSGIVRVLENGVELLFFSLDDFLNNLRSEINGRLNPAQMTYVYEDEKYKMKIYFKSLRGTKDKEEMTLQNAGGFILIKEK